MSDKAMLVLSEIYKTYHGKVLAYAAQLMGRDEAEDLAQEVFVKIGRSLDTLSEPSKLASWIFAITLNTVRDAARRRSSRVDRPFGSPDAAQQDAQAGDPLLSIPDARSRTPEEIAIRHEMVACYLDYVNKLPPAHYEVYVLSEFDNLSTQEIAHQLRVSQGTVKIRLHRARKQLNEELRCACRPYYNERGELLAEPRDTESEPTESD